MAEYIIEELYNEHKHKEYMTGLIRGELIRCKDCKHYANGICWNHQGLSSTVSDMDFCSKGEVTMKQILIERREEAIPEGYVKVVRCSECKHYKYNDDFNVNYCDLSDKLYGKNFYCAFGEMEKETE